MTLNCRVSVLGGGGHAVRHPDTRLPEWLLQHAQVIPLNIRSCLKGLSHETSLPLFKINVGRTQRILLWRGVTRSNFLFDLPGIVNLGRGAWLQN